MFRALVWKEWRQLALVRWGGIALGALLPIAFMTGAELARRGLLPTGSVKAYAPRDVMFELLPAALALGIWPLIGLMSAAQAFLGDRAAGTETFLLERPVSRTVVWCARLSASIATLAVVIAGTGAVAATAAALAGAPPGIGWSRWEILAAVGVGVGLLALVGGLLASSLLSSPMGAVLLGAALGALPAVLAAEFMFFRYARVGRVPLGIVVSVILLPAYVAASWLALCRGEPAGREKLRRAMTVLVTTLACVPVLFVCFAPIVLRANAASGEHSVVPSPSGGVAFLASRSDLAPGGWILDVATATKRVFLPPPVQQIAWRPDGSEAAVLTWSGPLGSRTEQRIDIRSTTDGRVLRSIPVGDAVIVQPVWADAGIVAIVSRAGSLDVEVIDPVTGVWRPTGFRSEGFDLDLVGPGDDRRVFVRAAVYDRDSPGGGPRGYRLHPVDAVAARVGPAIFDATGHAMLFTGWRGGFSPSGRFARVASSEGESDEPRIVDLRGGAIQPSTIIPSSALWTDGDRLVWHDDLDHTTRLFVATPEAPPRVLREWRDSQVGIALSPDGRAVFVSVIPAGGAPATDAQHRPPDAALFEGTVPTGASPEELVYLLNEGRFLTVGPPFSGRANDHRYTEWAGPITLARFAPGVVYLEDVGTPGKRRFVIGGPGNLE